MLDRASQGTRLPPRQHLDRDLGLWQRPSLSEVPAQSPLASVGFKSMHRTPCGGPWQLGPKGSG